MTAARDTSSPAMSLPCSGRNDSARSGWLSAGSLRRAVTVAGVVGFVLATVVQFASYGAGNLERRMLENALLWLVGVQGLLIGSGHLFSPDRSPTRSVGRGATPSSPRWGWRASLTGRWASLPRAAATNGGSPRSWRSRSSTWAPLPVTAGEMVIRGNRSPGNSAAVLVFDVAVPIPLIVLYALSRAI
jgi:hypothetical protein